MSMRLMTVETTRQARAVLVGREQRRDDRDQRRRQGPAATSWKIRSGIRNAAKNASSSAGRRNALAMTTTRT